MGKKGKGNEGFNGGSLNLGKPEDFPPAPEDATDATHPHIASFEKDVLEQAQRAVENLSKANAEGFQEREKYYQKCLDYIQDRPRKKLIKRGEFIEAAAKKGDNTLSEGEEQKLIDLLKERGVLKGGRNEGVYVIVDRDQEEKVDIDTNTKVENIQKLMDAVTELGKTRYINPEDVVPLAEQFDLTITEEDAMTFIEKLKAGGNINIDKESSSMEAPVADEDSPKTSEQKEPDVVEILKGKFSSDPEAATFNVDEALNTEGFAEFLSECPEGEMAIQNVDKGIIKARFEAFKAKEGAIRETVAVWTEKIQQDIGVEIDQDEINKLVTYYIEQEARGASPERVKERLDDALSSRQLGQDIAKAEKELREMGTRGAEGYIAQSKARLENLRNKEELFNKAISIVERMGRGWIFAPLMRRYQLWRYRSDKDAGRIDYAEQLADDEDVMKTVRDTYGINPTAKNLQRALGVVHEQIADIEWVRAHQDADKNRREELTSEVSEKKDTHVETQQRVFGPGGIQELHVLAKKAVAKKISILVGQGKDAEGKVAQAESAQDFLGSLEEADSLVEYSTKETVEVAKKTLDNFIDDEIAASVEGAMRAAPVKGESAFARLEGTLKKWIEKQQRVGSRKGAEAKTALVGMLTKNLEKFTGAKKIFLLQVITKLKVA